MVRTVHMNNFYETSLQISDPKIEFLTKTDVFENDHVQNFWKCTFWPEKNPCGVPRQQNKGCKHIPEYSRPKLYLKIYICIYISSKIGNFQLNLLFNGVGGMAGGLNYIAAPCRMQPVYPLVMTPHRLLVPGILHEHP